MLIHTNLKCLFFFFFLMGFLATGWSLGVSLGVCKQNNTYIYIYIYEHVHFFTCVILLQDILPADHSISLIVFKRRKPHNISK